MKKYLNKAERTALLMLLALTGHVEFEFSNWTHLTKDESKYLKTANTFINKAISSILSRLEGDYASILLRDAEASEMILVPKKEYKNRLQKEKELQDKDIVQTSREILETLAEVALDNCSPCNVDQFSCSLRTVFTELALEPFDCEAEGCPYEIRKDGYNGL